jgi:hypothetical protein
VDARIVDDDVHAAERLRGVYRVPHVGPLGYVALDERRVVRRLSANHPMHRLATSPGLLAHVGDDDVRPVGRERARSRPSDATRTTRHDGRRPGD